VISLLVVCIWNS